MLLPNYAILGHRGAMNGVSICSDLSRPRRFLPAREQQKSPQWWKKQRHGDVGGQPSDNNEHCDLRGCASHPIG